MYGREDVELALEGLAEGMSVREVCEMVGCDDPSVRDWAAGRLPRSYTGAPPPPRGGYDGTVARRGAGGCRDRRGEGGPRGRDDRGPAAQGGVGRPKGGGLRPGFDVEQEEDRARREIEAGDGPAPPRDHRFLEDLEELL